MTSIHRRPKQIKRAYMMMKNPPVIVGIDVDLDMLDSHYEFVDSKKLAEWQERCGDRLKVLSADWNKEIIVL